MGFIKGTKVTLGAPAVVSNVNFYSHAAAGQLRLGIYDNGSPKNLLWQSGSLANTAAGAWLSAPVGSGAPATLTLDAGTYWMAWQTDATADVPGYTAGSAGDGFVVSRPFGPFPAALGAAELTAERWSLYLDNAAQRNGVKDFNRYPAD